MCVCMCVCKCVCERGVVGKITIIKKLLLVNACFNTRINNLTCCIKLISIFYVIIDKSSAVSV